MRRLLILSLTMFLSVSAFAGFEGVISMKVTSGGENGKMTFSISDKGVRNDMELSAAKVAVNRSILFKSSDPNTAINLDHSAKTYSQVDLRRMGRKSAGSDEYTLKDLGKETLHGYLCRHVVLTGKTSGEMEMWTTRDIMDFDSFARVMGPHSVIKSAFEKTLKDAKADGFAVKLIHRMQKETVTMELEDVQKKELPDSLFQVPAGYKQIGGSVPGGAERENAMRDAMKNLSPDQKEMMQKMMKNK